MSAAPGGGATSNTIPGGIFFHAVVQGRDISVQLPPAITPALSGLPAPASAFIGRDQHVEQLLADLAPATGGGGGGQRAVLVSAVSGLAGIGKTELAVQTAARAL
ncbi:tetratricopeptide repeat protein, partial [Streptomyces sp. 900105245]